MKAASKSERDRVLKEVRVALEREPRINVHKFPVEMEFSDGERVRVGAKNAMVTLEGSVPSVPQREMVEFDAINFSRTR